MTVLLVCGGRHWRNRHLTFKVLDRARTGFNVRLVVSGGRPGADKLTSDWADARNIPKLVLTANREKLARSTGPHLHQRMLDDGRPDMVIAFPGGRGTADMVQRCKERGLLVWQLHQDGKWEKTEGFVSDAQPYPQEIGPDDRNHP